MSTLQKELQPSEALKFIKYKKQFLPQRQHAVCPCLTVVQRNNRCSLQKPYETYKDTVQTKGRIC